jgi:hypothetical protein
MKVSKEVESLIILNLDWASVQCSRDQYMIFDVMTPDGLGIHFRQPALLKYLLSSFS